MPRFCFDEKLFSFPAIDLADEEGLLMVGGNVTPERVIEAYRKGIFPWYNNDALPLWFSPDPRFVLFPSELHISRSMKKLFSKELFTFSSDQSFEEVIEKCSTATRDGQDGTWITKQMKKTYTELFYRGYAHSAEAWKGNELVGGMYGIRIGKVSFGESMFSNVSNASKFAFIRYVQQLAQNGIELIDCQVHTNHVATLGARLISRNTYIAMLQQLAH